MSDVRWLIVAAVLVVAAVALIVALSGQTSAVVDDRRVEQAIHDQLAPQMGSAGMLLPVCPEDIPVAAGRTFTCTSATMTGDPIEIRVTQLDARGRVDIHLATLVMDLVERRLRDELGLQLRTTVGSVDCGQNRPLRIADTFECSAELRDGGRDLTIVGIQTDGAGDFRWQVSGGL